MQDRKGIGTSVVAAALALALVASVLPACGHSCCLVEADCPEDPADGGMWIESDDPCVEGEAFPCRKVTACCDTVYCRLVPGNFTDTGSDTDDVALPDLECLLEQGATVEWSPNQPSEIDCGPGCAQVVFEEIHPYGEWDVSGRYLAYTVGGPGGGQGKVVDLETGMIATLLHPEWGGDVWLFDPHIDGDTIVFAAFLYDWVEEWEVDIVDLVSGTWLRCLHGEAPVDSEDVIQYGTPVRQGDLLAAIETSIATNAGRLLLCDTGAGTIEPLTPERAGLVDTRMAGDHVVWQDSLTENDAEIQAHRISTGETWSLTEDPAGQFGPRTDGTRVVWTDLRKGDGSVHTSTTWGHADVYMYDFDTGELTAITDQDWLQLYPDISGDRVVWQDSRDCLFPNHPGDTSNLQIWMYDLATGEEHRITSTPGYWTKPRIDGDRVFFTDTYGIYVQDLFTLGL
jgi:beta propeller repeat protein